MPRFATGQTTPGAMACAPKGRVTAAARQQVACSTHRTGDDDWVPSEPKRSSRIDVWSGCGTGPLSVDVDLVSGLLLPDQVVRRIVDQSCLDGAPENLRQDPHGHQAEEEPIPESEVGGIVHGIE